jgi:hypothetical protein
MAKASRIGSLVYKALPAYWRQGWMYRSFTGEALSLFKAGKKEAEIEQVLWGRYVQPVVSKELVGEAVNTSLNNEPKRVYRKKNSAYWNNKTIKSARRKANRQLLLQNAGLLVRASKIGSKLYARLPRKYKRRCYYQYLTGLAMRLLKEEISETDILEELLQALPVVEKYERAGPKKPVAVVMHRKGRYYFTVSLCKRFNDSAKMDLAAVGLGYKMECIRIPWQLKNVIKCESPDWSVEAF